jgi:hypothetical protein
MTDQAVSALRRRIIEDMMVRNFVLKTQTDYIRRSRTLPLSLGARLIQRAGKIGDDLLALAVIELLRHRERLAGQPIEARGAEFLQRRQVVQLGWSLPLIFDVHAKRTLEKFSGIDDGLGNLPLEDSLLRRVPHLELAARNLRGGDNLKIGERHEVSDFKLALAPNRQGWRLHTTNADYSPRALTEDDGRCAGQR